MPRLRDLKGEFLRYKPEVVNGVRSDVFHRVGALQEADGVIFLCPKCFAENNGPAGTHSVICWFVGKVPDDLHPIPGRWNPSGSGLDDLTFVGPGAASVLLTGAGCGWHGFVRNGSAD